VILQVSDTIGGGIPLACGEASTYSRPPVVLGAGLIASLGESGESGGNGGVLLVLILSPCCKLFVPARMSLDYLFASVLDCAVEDGICTSSSRVNLEGPGWCPDIIRWEYSSIGEFLGSDYLSMIGTGNDLNERIVSL
jgi:hypothetical protein